ncbi:MAG: sulfite exporter TauE/SafE family protein [Patescibacteria group bacterium]
MQKQTFFVRGTNCKSCEVVIERELKKQDNICSVHVSHAKRTITFQTKNDQRYLPEDLNPMLIKHGYVVGYADKEKSINKKNIPWQRLGAVVVLVGSLYIILDQIGLLSFSPGSAEPASLVGVLAIGFIASLSSCTAVVGGLVAAVSSAVAKDQKNQTPRERFQPHLLFNLGRIGGFAAFGALIGYLGSAIQLSATLNGFFVIIVAAAMIIIGINLLDIFPSPVISMPKWLAHKVHDLAESKDPKAPIILGAMTFFLPCGFTQSMQLFALTTQDPIQSALIMGIFALGTAPILLGIGSATSFASANTLKKVTQAAGIIVLVLGISNITNGLALVGFNPALTLALPDVTSTKITVEEGRQQISMDVTDRLTYKPDVLSVEAGTPVDWNIHGADKMGCASSLVLSAFGVNENLHPGDNLVQFTPTKPGKYTFSCSMGMIRGTMIVTPQES